MRRNQESTPWELACQISDCVLVQCPSAEFFSTTLLFLPVSHRDSLCLLSLLLYCSRTSTRIGPRYCGRRETAMSTATLWCRYSDAINTTKYTACPHRPSNAGPEASIARTSTDKNSTRKQSQDRAEHTRRTPAPTICAHTFLLDPTPL